MADSDTFAEWLFYRFNKEGYSKLDQGTAWNELPEEDRLFWQHEADAVRRAEKRGGFKRG